MLSPPLLLTRRKRPHPESSTRTTVGAVAAIGVRAVADVEAGPIDDSLPSMKRRPTRPPFKDPQNRMAPTTKRRNYNRDRRRTCLLWKTRRKSHAIHHLKQTPLELRSLSNRLR